MECGGLFAVIRGELPLLCTAFHVPFGDHSSLIVEASVQSVAHVIEFRAVQEVASGFEWPDAVFTDRRVGEYLAEVDIEHPGSVCL